MSTKINVTVGSGGLSDRAKQQQQAARQAQLERERTINLSAEALDKRVAAQAAKGLSLDGQPLYGTPFRQPQIERRPAANRYGSPVWTYRPSALNFINTSGPALVAVLEPPEANAVFQPSGGPNGGSCIELSGTSNFVIKNSSPEPKFKLDTALGMTLEGYIQITTIEQFGGGQVSVGVSVYDSDNSFGFGFGAAMSSYGFGSTANYNPSASGSASQADNFFSQWIFDAEVDAPPLNNGSWVHYALVFQATNAKFYINGDLASVIPNPRFPGDADFVISSNFYQVPLTTFYVTEYQIPSGGTAKVAGVRYSKFARYTEPFTPPVI
jgi:hypothetical protein